MRLQIAQLQSYEKTKEFQVWILWSSSELVRALYQTNADLKNCLNIFEAL